VFEARPRPNDISGVRVIHEDNEMWIADPGRIGSDRDTVDLDGQIERGCSDDGDLDRGEGDRTHIAHRGADHAGGVEFEIESSPSASGIHHEALR